MCLTVKVAASRPLPTAPIDPQLRSIAVLDVATWPTPEYHRRMMALPYVYEVTSRYGCGCNLRLSHEDIWALTSDEATEEEEESARESVEDLQRVADLVEIGLEAGRVELFMCWDTDLPMVEVTSRRTVTLAEFRRPGFVLVEREMWTILADES